MKAQQNCVIVGIVDDDGDFVKKIFIKIFVFYFFLYILLLIKRYLKKRKLNIQRSK
jgi:hypothetical protein